MLNDRSEERLPQRLCSPLPLAPALLATAALLAASAGAQDAKYRAEVRRTAYGIPHVKADDYGGLGYGLGYAFAQDNFCLLQDQMVTLRGERSRYFGPEGRSAQLGSAPTGYNNLRSDFFFKFVVDDATLRARVERASPDVRALMAGYAAGFNRYLRETPPEQWPAACRNAAWVKPITAVDLARLHFEQAIHASSERFIDAFFAAQPPSATSGEGPSAPTLGGEALRAELLGPEEARLGSNAYALGRDVTEDGRGLLLGNPHFPWFGPDRFYQMHLTIPGKLDVMGASLAGVPVVNIGFNKDVAWSHTVSTAYRFTPIELTLLPGSPTSYVFDGSPRTLAPQTVTVEVRGPDGRITSQTRTFWRSHLGPVIVNPALGFTWNTRTAYVLRDANLDNDRFVQQWLDLNRAKSVAEVREALVRDLGIPWVNTIAVDRQGNALYADIGTVPGVTTALQNACVRSPVAQAVFRSSGLPVLDGSTSACLWTVSDGSPQPGLLPGASLPSLVRSDWAMNSNDSFWLSNPAQPLTGFPRIVGDEGTPRSLRTRLGLLQIGQRLAGTDGLPGTKFNIKNLQDILFSNRNLAGELVAEALVRGCPADATLADGTRVPLADACRALAGWDRRNNNESSGAALFREFWARAGATPNLFAVPFDPRDAANTPRDLNLGDAAVRTAVYRALAEAARALAAAEIPLDAKLGDVQRAPRGERLIPIHGGSGAEGVFNVQTTTPLAKGGYAPVHGTSYVQVVGFGADGPNAEALLSYSQSTDPASPFFADQTELYSQKRWVRLPFSDAEIVASPGYSTRTLSE